MLATRMTPARSVKVTDINTTATYKTGAAISRSVNVSKTKIASASAKVTAGRMYEFLGAATSVRLQVEGLHDRCPLLLFAREVVGEILRRAAARLGAEPGERTRHRFGTQRGIGGGVELGDDRRRRAARRQERGPGAGGERRIAGLRHGRHIGQLGETLARGDRERAQLAVQDKLQRGR